MKSIDVNSVVDNENNLMNDLQQSYPDQDIQDMKRSLGLLPISIIEDYMSNCAKSSSGTSDLSLVNHNRENSQSSQGAINGLDYLAIGTNGND